MSHIKIEKKKCMGIKLTLVQIVFLQRLFKNVQKMVQEYKRYYWAEVKHFLKTTEEKLLIVEEFIGLFSLTKSSKLHVTPS